MRAPSPARLALGIIVSTTILLSATAGEALAAIEVRLLHAVPGGPEAQLRVSGNAVAAAPRQVGFGQATGYAKAPSGPVTATVMVDGKEFAGSTELADDGRYTLVATRRTKEEETVTLYDDGQAAPGKTRWRVVHAAPELDTAEFTLGDRVIGRLGRSEGSRYRTVEPGTYPAGARRPGDDQALVEQPGLSLVAGSAQTAYLVGSGGERTRFVVLEDDAATPQVAPATGLGGLDGETGTPWLAALGAALLAGALGGAAYTRLASHREPGRD